MFINFNLCVFYLMQNKLKKKYHPYRNIKWTIGKNNI